MSRRAVLTVVELTMVATALGAAVEVLETAAHLPDPAHWVNPAMIAAITAFALAAAAALILLARLVWLAVSAPRRWWRRGTSAAAAATSRLWLPLRRLGRRRTKDAERKLPRRKARWRLSGGRVGRHVARIVRRTA